MYECFHCGQRAVIWNGDFSFDDYCIEGDGIVHVLTCTNCGAEITYEVPCGAEGDDDEAATGA